MFVWFCNGISEVADWSVLYRLPAETLKISLTLECNPVLLSFLCLLCYVYIASLIHTYMHIYIQSLSHTYMKYDRKGGPSQVLSCLRRLPWACQFEC